MNDETKRTLRDLFGRIGEWLYEHAAETLAISVSATAGLAFSLWLHLGHITDQLAHVVEQQQHDRLCQRVSDCSAFTAVENLANNCGMGQMLCQDRIGNMLERLRETERRLNNLSTTPAARPDSFTGTMGKELEARIKALETKP